MYELRFGKSADGTFDEFSLVNGTGKSALGDFDGEGKPAAAVFRPSTGVRFLQYRRRHLTAGRRPTGVGGARRTGNADEQE